MSTFHIRQDVPSDIHYVKPAFPDYGVCRCPGPVVFTVAFEPFGELRVCTPEFHPAQIAPHRVLIARFDTAVHTPFVHAILRGTAQKVPACMINSKNNVNYWMLSMFFMICLILLKKSKNIQTAEEIE